MAKVYLTREQADRMKGMLEEDNATLEVDVTPKAGESIEQSVKNSVLQTKAAAGDSVAKNANYNISGKNLNCSRRYSMRSINEAKRRYLESRSKSISVSDFFKKIEL